MTFTNSSAAVTFVNPEPRKDVHVFAWIADVLFRRRPEIPLLVVEGAAKQSFLPALGVDLSHVGSLRAVPTTPNPLLMPSLAEPAGMPGRSATLLEAIDQLTPDPSVRQIAPVRSA